METPDVDSSETLYRQVSPGGNPIYYDGEKEPPVHWSLFIPSKRDTDGLSLIRARFRTKPWAAYRAEKPSTRHRLALIRAGFLRDVAEAVGIGALHCDPSPDVLDEQYGEPWAHCVAREINRDAYDSDGEAKKRIKSWAYQVAASLSNTDVEGPFESPAEQDAYRPN